MSEQRELVTSQQGVSLALMEHSYSPDMVLHEAFKKAKADFDGAVGDRETSQAIVTVRIEAVAE